MIRPPIERAFSHWRFAENLALKLPGENQWAVELMKDGTFENHIDRSIQAFTACARKANDPRNCTTSLVLRFSMYDDLVRFVTRCFGVLSILSLCAFSPHGKKLIIASKVMARSLGL